MPESSQFEIYGMISEADREKYSEPVERLKKRKELIDKVFSLEEDIKYLDSTILGEAVDVLGEDLGQIFIDLEKIAPENGEELTDGLKDLSSLAIIDSDENEGGFYRLEDLQRLHDVAHRIRGHRQSGKRGIFDVLGLTRRSKEASAISKEVSQLYASNKKRTEGRDRAAAFVTERIPQDRLEEISKKVEELSRIVLKATDVGYKFMESREQAIGNSTLSSLQEAALQRSDTACKNYFKDIVDKDEQESEKTQQDYNEAFNYWIKLMNPEDTVNELGEDLTQSLMESQVAAKLERVIDMLHNIGGEEAAGMIKETKFMLSKIFQERDDVLELFNKAINSDHDNLEEFVDETGWNVNQMLSESGLVKDFEDFLQEKETELQSLRRKLEPILDPMQREQLYTRELKATGSREVNESLARLQNAYYFRSMDIGHEGQVPQLDVPDVPWFTDKHLKIIKGIFEQEMDVGALPTEIDEEYLEMMFPKKAYPVDKKRGLILQRELGLKIGLDRNPSISGEEKRKIINEAEQKADKEFEKLGARLPANSERVKGSVLLTESIVPPADFWDNGGYRTTSNAPDPFFDEDRIRFTITRAKRRATSLKGQILKEFQDNGIPIDEEKLSVVITPAVISNQQMVFYRPVNAERLGTYPELTSFDPDHVFQDRKGNTIETALTIGNATGPTNKHFGAAGLGAVVVGENSRSRHVGFRYSVVMKP